MKQHKEIPFDDLMCICELADLYLKSRHNNKFWEVENAVVTDFKWFLLQCNTDKFKVSCEIL